MIKRLILLLLMILPGASLLNPVAAQDDAEPGSTIIWLHDRDTPAQIIRLALDGTQESLMLPLPPDAVPHTLAVQRSGDALVVCWHDAAGETTLSLYALNPVEERLRLPLGAVLACEIGPDAVYEDRLAFAVINPYNVAPQWVYRVVDAAGGNDINRLDSTHAQLSADIFGYLGLPRTLEQAPEKLMFTMQSFGSAVIAAQPVFTLRLSDESVTLIEDDFRGLYSYQTLAENQALWLTVNSILPPPELNALLPPFNTVMFRNESDNYPVMQIENGLLLRVIAVAGGRYALVEMLVPGATGAPETVYRLLDRAGQVQPLALEADIIYPPGTESGVLVDRYTPDGGRQLVHMILWPEPSEQVLFSGPVTQTVIGITGTDKLPLTPFPALE